MSDIAIRVEGLSKQYRIGGPQVRYRTLRESLVGAVQSPMRRAGRLLRGEAATDHQETIWALKDVSFEVKHGEVLGIIGRNGAGKSTLLKILSRITAPTEGRVDLYGRVGSLLEVGTGFHPELTGLENIYLNGAILGMKRAEIDGKFDEIVAFAELEKFLDTPVKHYSSGMYVRLAFAVAAHLDPEILLVDEVLAVGDAAFQKKCLGKMGEVAGEGRTVLFVSHNMGAVENLCSQAILLEFGQRAKRGNTHEVVSHYLDANRNQDSNALSTCHRTGTGRIRILSFHLESLDGERLEAATSGAPVALVFGFSSAGDTSPGRASFSFSVHTDREYGLFHYYSHFSGTVFEQMPSRGYVKCVLPEVTLAPGNYLVMCRVVTNGDQSSGVEADWPRVFLPMAVMAGDFYGTGNANLSSWGPILVKGSWSMVPYQGEDER